MHPEQQIYDMLFKLFQTLKVRWIAILDHVTLVTIAGKFPMEK